MEHHACERNGLRGYSKAAVVHRNLDEVCDVRERIRIAAGSDDLIIVLFYPVEEEGRIFLGILTGKRSVHIEVGVQICAERENRDIAYLILLIFLCKLLIECHESGRRYDICSAEFHHYLENGVVAALCDISSAHRLSRVLLVGEAASRADSVCKVEIREYVDSVFGSIRKEI